MATEISFRTLQHHGYNVNYSSLNPNLLACAAAQNYGISGSGILFILDEDDGGKLKLVNHCSWKDSLFDVTWSQKHAHILASGSGDGSIQIWNLHQKEPLAVLKKHFKEVNTVDWNHENLLISGAWDGTAVLWDPETSSHLNTFSNTNKIVYDVSWCPHIRTLFGSVSGDGGLRIWDINQPAQPAFIINAHHAEVLSCSWNIFKEGIIVTSSVDGLIRGWDIRIPDFPIFQLTGHRYAVRRVKCSPHKESEMVSCSYDFTTRLWDWDVPTPIHTFENHTEFVYGLDFNPTIPNKFADCGWDEQIKIISY